MPRITQTADKSTRHKEGKNSKDDHHSSSSSTTSTSTSDSRKSKHHKNDKSHKTKGGRVEKKKHSSSHHHSLNDNDKGEKKKRRKSRVHSEEARLINAQNIPRIESRPKLFIRAATLAKLVRMFSDNIATSRMIEAGEDMQAFAELEPKEQNEKLREYRLKIRKDALQYFHEGLEETLRHIFKNAITIRDLVTMKNRITLGWVDVLAAISTDTHLHNTMPGWIDQNKIEFEQFIQKRLQEQEKNRSLKATKHAIEIAQTKLSKLTSNEQKEKEKESSNDTEDHEEEKKRDESSEEETSTQSKQKKSSPKKLKKEKETEEMSD